MSGNEVIDLLQALVDLGSQVRVILLDDGLDVAVGDLGALVVGLEVVEVGVGEGLLLAHDLGQGDLLQQRGSARGHVGQGQLVGARGALDVAVDKVVELLGVLH